MASTRSDQGEDRAVEESERLSWDEEAARNSAKREGVSKWHGTLGRVISLTTNCYRPVEVKRSIVIQYRVEVYQGNRGIPCTAKRYCRRFFWRAALDPENRRIFFSPNQLVYDDQSLLFSVKPLHNERGHELGDGEVVEIPSFAFAEYCSLTGTTKETPVRISIQRTGSLYVGPPLTPAVEQFLTLLLRQAASRPAFDNNGVFVPRLQRWHAEGNRIYELPWQGGFWREVTHATVLLRGLTCKMRADASGFPIANLALTSSLFAHAEFSLLEVYVAIRGEKPLTPSERHKLRNYSLSGPQAIQIQNELQGLKLRSRCGPKKDYQLHSIYRETIDDRHETIADHHQFPIESEAFGGEVTIEEYYRRRYNYILEYPNLPLFRMQPAHKKIYIPMELVNISGEIMRIVRKLQASYAAEVLKTTTIPPDQHFGAIDFLARNRAGLMTSDTCNAFGLDFGDLDLIQMMQVKGRVLPAPRCMFTLGLDAMTRSRLPEVVPIPVVFAMVLVGRVDAPVSRRAVLNLMAACRQRGITFAERNPREYRLNEHANLNALLSRVRGEAFREHGGIYVRGEVAFLLIFCMRVHEGNADFYRNAKAHCEMSSFGFGLMSQFIREKTLGKMAGQRPGDPGHRGTLANLVVKVNGKLAGVNNRIEDTANVGKMNPKSYCVHDRRLRRSCPRWTKFTNSQDPTLFIGIDVTHPPRDEPTQESVAAVVANIDDNSTRFAGDIAIQPQENVEQVSDLARLVYNAIYAFSSNTSHMPKHIVVLRDGVSDSQMGAASMFELNHIGDACRQFAEDFEKPQFRPTVTYIVVQKRNTTRVKPSSEVTATGNVPSGTVIDETITSPSVPNFFLCAHKGLLGTSRIPHYTIVYNTWDALDMDDWQIAMFTLCHLVARSMTPVSIPAPVYYADILCGRARQHVAAMRDINGDEYDPSLVEIVDRLKQEQFFL